MTRKQALELAIQALAGNEEAVQVQHIIIDELHVQAMQEFIREYLRIQPISAEDYNVRRTRPSRGWFAIARYNYTRRWRILLEKLNLPIYNNRGMPNSVPQLKVRGISDYIFEE